MTTEQGLETILHQEAENASLPSIVNGKIINYLCVWCSETIQPEQLVQHYKQYHYNGREFKTLVGTDKY